MVFLVYYPRMKATRTCLSGLTPQVVMKLSDVAQVKRYHISKQFKGNLFIKYFYSIDDNDMNPLIVMPSNFANYRLSNYVLNRSFWDQQLMSRSHDLIRYAPQKAQCYWRKIDGVDGMDEIVDLITYPNITNKYVEPMIKCQNLVMNSCYTCHSIALYTLIIIFVSHVCL